MAEAISLRKQASLVPGHRNGPKPCA